MAKSQKKSNREARKPKQEKPKPQAASSSVPGVLERAADAGGGGKKPGR